MVGGIYNLKWNHFNVNQNYNLEELLTKNIQTDVTLVSDDKVAFSAHKFVLGASSSVLKDLLISNPHSHPIVYLNGVKNFELNSILQFIYLGKIQFFQSRKRDWMLLFNRQIHSRAQDLVYLGIIC